MAQRWRWVLSPLAAGFLVVPAGIAVAQVRIPPTFTTPMARALNQVRERAMRPVPTVPPTVAPRADMVWVPDRFVTVPGTAGLAHVPAHWERRLPDGEWYLPPLTAVTPAGPVVLFPAGRYPPADHRQAP